MQQSKGDKKASNARREQIQTYRKFQMSMLEKIKVASHAACCGTYTMFFSGFHFDELYVVAAAAYAGLTFAEYWPKVK